MATVDFKSKGLNQKIFSKKAVRAIVGRKSGAFSSIMEDKSVAHVIDTASEKRVFYDALRKRGAEAGQKGITKNVLKKVLGDVEHSGQFSHMEMHHLGEELIGGPASARIIRDHHKSAEQSVEGKPEVDMRKVYQEIMDKRKTSVENAPADKQKSKVFNFAVSNNNLRNAEQLLSQTNDEQPTKSQASSVLGYLEDHKHDENDVAKTKSLLAKIQDESESENEETDLAA